LGGYHLRSTHPGGEHRHAVLAGLIATRLRKNRPEICFAQILRNPSASPVISAQSRLCYHVPLLGGTGKPAHRLRIILLYVISSGITGAKRKLCHWITLISHAT